MAGSVNTTPAAMDSPAEPVVWTMLFSRMVDRPRVRKNATDSTAMGIEADTVSPILSARYTLEAANTIPRMAPRIRARTVSSAGDRDAGTKGSKLVPGVAVSGRGAVVVAMVPLGEGTGIVRRRRARRKRALRIAPYRRPPSPYWFGQLPQMLQWPALSLPSSECFWVETAAFMTASGAKCSRRLLKVPKILAKCAWLRPCPDS